MVLVSIIAVNSTSIVIERLRHGNTTSDWASLVNFLHHIFFSNHHVVFVNTKDSVLIRDEASLTWVAVSAQRHRAAYLSIVMTASFIDRACLVGNLVLSHPLEGV